VAAPGELGDVLTLGQDRDAVRHDLVDGDLGEARHGLRRLAGPDPGLYVARAKGAVHLDLQLAEPRTIAPEGRTKPWGTGQALLAASMAAFMRSVSRVACSNASASLKLNAASAFGSGFLASDEARVPYTRLESWMKMRSASSM